MTDKILYQIVKDEAWDKFATPRFVKALPDVPIKHRYKVSICTNCMNRAGDLEQTLHQNILDNIGYLPNVEFIVLNYNSQDHLDELIKDTLWMYIESGLLTYYKTVEPQYYSMTHSRNITFKLATGDIVTNVDADHFTNKGFAQYLNMLANQRTEKVVFVKSRQKNRGRLGFFKHEFVDLLGGYNEDIQGYGYDDADLLHRATALGFVAVRFGGQFCRITLNHRRHPSDNYEVTDWRYTQRRNTLISLLSMAAGYYKANNGRHWGKAKLTKNFKEEIEI